MEVSNQDTPEAALDQMDQAQLDGGVLPDPQAGRQGGRPIRTARQGWWRRSVLPTSYPSIVSWIRLIDWCCVGRFSLIRVISSLVRHWLRARHVLWVNSWCTWGLILVCLSVCVDEGIWTQILLNTWPISSRRIHIIVPLVENAAHFLLPCYI